MADLQPSGKVGTIITDPNYQAMTLAEMAILHENLPDMRTDTKGYIASLDKPHLLYQERIGNHETIPLSTNRYHDVFPVV
ncbi:hypothetical protein SAMN04488556_3984 [Halostagnicola kamekurae]|uniref:Uncharacterized protein n=1 Tax=Halostagnicola kamekurae TaxID=619731 RepID=A0A1I6UP74_9EURY|nr:hypothetical protein SAMN04488556_3984 [Halostagnicola kamekurae]